MELAAEDYSQRLFDSVWCDYIGPCNLYAERVVYARSLTPADFIIPFSSGEPTANQLQVHERSKLNQLLTHQKRCIPCCLPLIRAVSSLYLPLTAEIESTRSTVNRAMKEDSPFISYVSFKRAFHAKSWFEEPFSFHNAIEIRFEWGFLDCFKELPLFEFVRLTSMQAPNNGYRCVETRSLFGENEIGDALENSSIVLEEPVGLKRSSVHDWDPLTRLFDYLPVTDTEISTPKQMFMVMQPANCDGENLNGLTLVKCFKMPKVHIRKEKIDLILKDLLKLCFHRIVLLNIGIRWKITYSANHSMSLERTPFTAHDNRHIIKQAILPPIRREQQSITVQGFLKLRGLSSIKIPAGEPKETRTRKMRRSWQLRYDESGVETFSQLKSIACILSDKLLPHSDLIFELFKNHRIELIVRRFGDSFNVDMILDETTAVIFIPIKMIDRLSADYVQFHLGRQYSKVYVIVELFVAEKILYPFNRPGLYAVGQWLGSIKKFSPCSIVTIYSKSAQHSAMIIRSLIDGIGQDKPPVWWNRRWLLRNETVQERFLWMLGSFNPHTAHLCLSRVNLRKLILESEINIKNNSSVFSSFKRAIESELR